MDRKGISQTMMLLGVVGLNGCGKSTFVKYLVEAYDFQAFSLSDIIRDEVRRRQIPETRQHLIDMGNELRRRYGSDVLAERTAQKMTTAMMHRNCVVDSIRHPCEVDRLARVPGRRFLLVAIDTPATRRFDYLKQRGRSDDTSVNQFEQFLQIEEQEKANVDSHGQQVVNVMQMAHVLLQNDQGLDVFLERIRSFYERYIVRTTMRSP